MKNEQTPYGNGGLYLPQCCSAPKQRRGGLVGSIHTVRARASYLYSYKCQPSVSWLPAKLLNRETMMSTHKTSEPHLSGSSVRLYVMSDPEWVVGQRPTTTGQRRPLGNYQLAAVLFFERHGKIQRDDSAFGLIVGRRLSSDALQPEAGRGHQCEQRSAVPGGEADDLI
jgi:hypothetical protein